MSVKAKHDVGHFVFAGVDQSQCRVAVFFWNESCEEAPYAVSLGLALWFQRRSLLKKNWRSCDGRGLVLVLNIEFISLTSMGSFLKDIITVVTLLYYR